MRTRYKLGLSFVATTLSLGAAEALFRHEEGTVVFPWDEPGRGFATRPHTRGANAWGFHEREIPPGEHPGVHRVVVLGDSMTWGTGTAEQTWTRAMEDTLREKYGETVQILNFGHYGYDAEACAATLRHQAARWLPDEVIYASYTNDVLRNTTIELGRFGYPVWIGSQSAIFPGPLRRSSAFARAVEGALLAPGVEERPDLDFYRAQVADMAAQARALGAAFYVLALAPHVFAGEVCEADAPFCEKHHAWLDAQERVHEALQVPSGSLLPGLQDLSEESFYPANPRDHEHPSPAGQRIYGELAADGRKLLELLGSPPGYIPL